jgi:hypothetical protein
MIFPSVCMTLVSAPENEGVMFALPKLKSTSPAAALAIVEVKKSIAKNRMIE